MISILEVVQKNKLKFSFSRTLQTIWRKKVHESQKLFNVFFDLENDESVSDIQTITIKQKHWKSTNCSFNCQLYSAGGDWEDPVYYFRCQIISGYSTVAKSYVNDGIFIFIPSELEGNYHLVSNNGRQTAPSDDSLSPKIKRSDEACWKSLHKYLTQVVYSEIKKIKSGK